MIKEITPEQVYANAILEFGVEGQIDMLHEEVGELLSALNKYKRGRCGTDEVITEIADVQILLGQMALIFGEEEVRDEFERKLIRLQQRIDERRAKR